MACAYVRGAIKERRSGVKAGSYAVAWTNVPRTKGEPSSKGFRLAAYPDTLFRAKLAAILEALKQAKEKKLRHVQIVTDADKFPYYYNQGWKNSFGQTVANKYYYRDICELVNDFEQVKFVHEPPSEKKQIWNELNERCEEASAWPVPSKDTSEYKLGLEEITQDPSIWKGTGMPRVRYFKYMVSNLPQGLVWDTVDGEKEGIVRETLSIDAKGGHAQIMKNILTMADEAKLSMILVRTNSKLLILKTENYLNVWARYGWKSAMRRSVDDKEIWKEVYELKKNIKIYWSYFEEPDESDKQANEKIREARAAILRGREVPTSKAETKKRTEAVGDEKIEKQSKEDTATIENEEYYHNPKMHEEPKRHAKI